MRDGGLVKSYNTLLSFPSLAFARKPRPRRRKGEQRRSISASAEIAILSDREGWWWCKECEGRRASARRINRGRCRWASFVVAPIRNGVDEHLILNCLRALRRGQGLSVRFQRKRRDRKSTRLNSSH